MGPQNTLALMGERVARVRRRVPHVRIICVCCLCVCVRAFAGDAYGSDRAVRGGTRRNMYDTHNRVLFAAAAVSETRLVCRYQQKKKNYTPSAIKYTHTLSFPLSLVRLCVDGCVPSFLVCVSLTLTPTGVRTVANTGSTHTHTKTPKF